MSEGGKHLRHSSSGQVNDMYYILPSSLYHSRNYHKFYFNQTRKRIFSSLLACKIILSQIRLGCRDLYQHNRTQIQYCCSSILSLSISIRSWQRPVLYSPNIDIYNQFAWLYSLKRWTARFKTTVQDPLGIGLDFMYILTGIYISR